MTPPAAGPRTGPRLAARGPRARAAAPAIALTLLLAACGGPRLAPWPEQDRLARFGPEVRASLVEARVRLDERDTLGALRSLREARAAAPDDVGIAIALQDAELQHLARGEPLETLEAWLEANPERRDADPAREYWSWYLARSRRTGSALDRLLTARVEPDRAAALYQLQLLAEEEPGLAWAHLGVAHAQLRLGQVPEARAALDRALALDPTNPRVRRLQPIVFARAGRDALAIRSLERWLERTAEDPLIGLAERDAVALELARALLDARSFGAAEERLDGFVADPRFDTHEPELRYRAFLLRAAAREGQGRYGLALEDAQRAALEVPERLLPHVHRAVLLEYRLDDPDGALAAWGEVERLAADAPRGDLLGAYLFAQRARVESARLTGLMGGDPPPAGGAGSDRGASAD